mmetsp:Transcript_10194/g.21467  ORF Transcript_10194/g.21467 Transcript_10194/m.21467 type:complete len:114 (+) Transcript_10194:107-448(+)
MRTLPFKNHLAFGLETGTYFSSSPLQARRTSINTSQTNRNAIQTATQTLRTNSVVILVTRAFTSITNITNGTTVRPNAPIRTSRVDSESPPNAATVPAIAARPARACNGRYNL